MSNKQKTINKKQLGISNKGYGVNGLLLIVDCYLAGGHL